ncbi:hypothetical protein C8Q80DRAFT_1335140 [Daedaleopsis nitida]|nr:hypothetical protein C8Q80DRAFT_1335140 [Daedaleopsis nitida]
MFEDDSTPDDETNMYTTLRSGICPGYEFVATPHLNDKSVPTKRSVDTGMYPRGHAPRPSAGSSYARVYWFWIEIPMECKADSTKEDPVDDDEPDFEPTAAKRKDSLGQILSYAELVFNCQQRTWLFMIIFLGDYPRIIRIDRAGLFATEKFNYKLEGDKLTDFLWRYSRMSAEERGHDTTAERVDPLDFLGKEMKKMAEPSKTPETRDYIRQLFKKSLNPNWSRWLLKVHRQRIERFLVGKPHFQAPGVAGRGTRGSGDAWRVDRDGVEQEGAILQELNQIGVKNTWHKYHPDDADCPLKRHQHYRIVVREVGKPLDQFSCSLQLVFALACCIEAHQAANNAGIIHRDISAGNILLYQDDNGDWRGILNDWEMSKRVPAVEAASGDRQPDRTVGTWQFMSAHALNDRYRAIIIPDELEAFLHVLLYYAIRFLPHNCPDAAVGNFLYHYFDDFTHGAHHFTCGPMKYEAMRQGMIDITLLARGSADEDKATQPQQILLMFTMPNSSAEHPVNVIISTLLKWFAAYYALDDAQDDTSSGDTTGTSHKKAVTPKAVTPKAVSAWLSKHLGKAGTSQTTAAPQPPPPQAKGKASKEGNEALAKNLQTHDAILGLLARVLSQDFPDDDKCADKRPKDGYAPPKDPVPVASTQTGTKRTRSNQASALGSSKRTRSVG